MTTSRVSPYDVNFAYAESPRVRSSIVTAYAFPESSSSSQDLTEWLAARAGGIEVLRQRLVIPLGGIGDAYWTDTPEFDPRDHIDHLPAMGWDQLVDFITELHEQTFDEARPRWSLYIVRNVIGVGAMHAPCTVVVLRFHHSMADGMGVAAIARSLFSADVGTPSPASPDSGARLAALELARVPLRPFLVLADLWRLIGVSRRASRDRKAGLWSMPDAQPRATRLNGSLSGRRESAIVFQSVAGLRVVARAHGVSVNDVVLSVIGRTIAAHLGDPDQAIAASVPVSVRSLLDPAMRNALGFGTVPLRPDLPFPEQVVAVHEQVRAERDRLNLPSFAAMYGALPRLPGWIYRILYRTGQRRAARKPKPDTTQLRVSTIPKGSAEHWTLAGLPAVACFGVTPINDGLGVNHTVSTFGDNLSIGILADPEQLTDLPTYLASLQAELDGLRAAYSSRETYSSRDT